MEKLKKIWKWIKDHLFIVGATVGSIFAAIFAGLCSSKHRGLDTNNQLCEAAERGTAKASESVASASRQLDAAEGTVEQLKQSIASSETRLDSSTDTVGKLIRDTEAIEAIIDKYNK